MKATTLLWRLLKEIKIQDEFLFPTQSELARKIAAMQDSPYVDSPFGLRSLLQQILAGKRRCPEKLVDAIVTLIATKAGPEIASEVRAAIEKHNAANRPSARRIESLEGVFKRAKDLVVQMTPCDSPQRSIKVTITFEDPLGDLVQLVSEALTQCGK